MMNVIDQIRLAARAGNRLALAVGVVLGAFVPSTAFAITHYGIDLATPLWLQINAYTVLACLVYSASTVWTWMCSVTRSRVKATGFCVMIELAMVFSGLFALSIACLVLLVGINAVATGANLALDQKEAKESAKKAKEKPIVAKAVKETPVTKLPTRARRTQSGSRKVTRKAA